MSEQKPPVPGHATGLPKRLPALAGTDAVAAIAFSLSLADDAEMRAFLVGWTEGDTREWPAFRPVVLS